MIQKDKDIESLKQQNDTLCDEISLSDRSESSNRSTSYYKHKCKSLKKKAECLIIKVQRLRQDRKD